MKTAERLQIKYEKPDKLNMADYNPRVISEEMMNNLKASILEFGFVDPIIVNKKTKLIVGGHQRLVAYNMIVSDGKSADLKKLKAFGIDKELPVVHINVSEAREKQLNVLLNRVGGSWDYHKLFDVLSDVSNAGLDIEMSGFDFDTVELLSGIEKELGVDDLDALIDDEQDKKGKSVLISNDEMEPIHEDKDKRGSLATLKDDVHFPSNLPFQIPEILPDKLLDLPAKKFINFLYGKTPELKNGEWLHCICNHLHKNAKLNKKTLMSFSTWDEYFEKVWNDPAGQTIRLLNLGFGAITSPDFSLLWNEPLAVQLWAVYRHRWVARYWQEAGLLIIPYVNVPSYRNRDFSLLGYPKNMPCIFMQLQNVSHKELEQEMLDGVKYALQELKPKSLLMYSGKTYDEQKLIKYCKKYVPEVIFIETRLTSIREDEKKRKSKKKS